jgi:hypothetical protein
VTRTSILLWSRSVQGNNGLGEVLSSVWFGFQNSSTSLQQLEIWNLNY